MQQKNEQVMQQKQINTKELQTKQTQGVEQEKAGMQIGGLGNAGTNINSGAIGGKGATQEVQR